MMIEGGALTSLPAITGVAAGVVAALPASLPPVTVAVKVKGVPAVKLLKATSAGMDRNILALRGREVWGLGEVSAT